MIVHKTRAIGPSYGKGIWNQLDKTYKSPYIKEYTFAMEAMRSALESFLGNFPKPTYAEELQRKLRMVRAQILYNETWRIPTLEEAKEGKEIEIQTSWGWQPGTYPTILNSDTHVGLFYSHLPDEEKFKKACLRIKI